MKLKEESDKSFLLINDHIKWFKDNSKFTAVQTLNIQTAFAQAIFILNKEIENSEIANL